MECPCWLLVAVMAYVCVPGSGSVCWESSICNDLSNKEKILGCIHFCMSAFKNEFPELSALALKVYKRNDDELLLRIILSSLTSEGKISESNLKAHIDKQQSYSMEHFRWGKPSGDKIQKQKQGSKSNKRRSYSMEHFRWGKPSGRKRRPVKIFAAAPEGGGSSEGFPQRAGHQLRRKEDLSKRELKQTQGLSKSKVNSKSQGQLSPQERKSGTYRMCHFRWGTPPASKRNGNLMRKWVEKRQGPLAKFFRNVIIKDVQKIIG